MLVYWLLPMILFLGIITSYQDLRYGKIKNKWIVFGLIYAIVAYHILFFFSENYSLNISHFYSLLLNGILALTTGFLLWFMRLWTAGDAKLFFVYMLLIPPTLTLGKIDLQFSDFLINIFVPIGLYLVFSALEKTSLKTKALHFKETLQPKKLITQVLYLFVLIWPITLITSFVGLQNITILVILIIALLMYKIKKLFSKKSLTILIGLSLVRLLFDKNILIVDAWKQFLLLLIFLIIIRFFLIGLSYEAFTKKISLNKIREGMVPAEVIFKSGKTYKKIKITFGIFRSLPLGKKRYIFQPKPEGLSNEDIKKIHSLIKRIKFNDIRIQETISFAPFLFIGALLQILLNDNVVTYIRVLFQFVKF